LRTPLTKERLISDWSRNINVAVVRTTAVSKTSDSALSAFFEAGIRREDRHRRRVERILSGRRHDTMTFKEH
jgi:methyl-accepting chemotaxis protein